MALLMLFALVAGAGTALSPCVLPVLPALLSAGATGGRRRPLGIVLGLATTFTVTIVGLATRRRRRRPRAGGDAHAGDRRPARLRHRGRRAGRGRRASRRRSARLARFGPRAAGDGFASGLLVGAALGFVYAPCAGPILAAVVAVGAASARTVAVGLAFALGSARRPARARARRPRAGRTACARAGRGPRPAARAGGRHDRHRRSRWRRASTCASSRRSPTTCPPRSSTRRTALEDSHAVASASTTCAGRSQFAVAGTRAPGVESARLPRLGAAPDFTGNAALVQHAGRAAAEPREPARPRRARRLLDLHVHQLPAHAALPRGVGHALPRRRADRSSACTRPSSRSSATPATSRRRSSASGIRYPVAQDNKLATWDAWGNQYWPAEYLIDARGQVRDAHFGEGEYDRTEMKIRALLREAGHPKLGGDGRADGRRPPDAQATPETYLGLARAQRFDPPPLQGTHTYAQPSKLAPSHFALAGTWDVSPDAATARAGAEIHAAILGKDVYLVLSPPARGGGDGAGAARRQADRRRPGRRRRATGRRAGRSPAPVPPRLAPASEHHALTLRVSPGVQAYAFTFG